MRVAAGMVRCIRCASAIHSGWPRTYGDIPEIWVLAATIPKFAPRPPAAVSHGCASLGRPLVAQSTPGDAPFLSNVKVFRWREVAPHPRGWSCSR